MVLEAFKNTGVQVVNPKGLCSSQVDNCVMWQCALQCNSHVSHTYDLTSTSSDVAAACLYPRVSYLNHSCRPNSQLSNHGGMCYVHALYDLSEGTEVTLSYIPLLQPRAERQGTLQQCFYFHCECDRCIEEVSLDPMDAFQCTKGIWAQTVLGHKVHVCLRCGSNQIFK